ncbi:zinc finger (CHY type) protein, putative [Eimeria praecox]|uniref:Zinc finger (CHY type) protein, putative n=1 Tax=Eimeria praecox TaxID=51316 RepID=U6G359_9EIME|nr:zinc finger (CHY type) protein, putative [Eimeria praecox]
MEMFPDDQHGDTSPPACPHGPSGRVPHQHLQNPNGPQEPPQTRSHPLSEANKRQEGQVSIQERPGHQRGPPKSFTPALSRNPQGPSRGDARPNNFYRQNHMKGHFHGVRKTQQSQQREHLQDSPGPSCPSGVVAFSADDWKGEANKVPGRTPAMGQQQNQQQGQTHVGTQHNKRQQQQSRRCRSQQQVLYMWRPVPQEKEEPQAQKQEQKQHQEHQQVQQHEEQQQKQRERQQQRHQRAQQRGVGRKPSQQRQRQQPEVQHDFRQRRQQSLQGQQQETPNQHQQQQQQQQEQEKQEHQQQQRQRRQPASSRPACARPQLAEGVSAVVVELQRLRHQFSSSFSLLSCHPLLLPLLKQQPYSASKGGSFPGEFGSPTQRISNSAVAAHPTIRQSSNTTCEVPCSLATPAPALDLRKDPEDSCRVGCAHKTATGGREAASCEPEIASSILCKFELQLIPTDPEFDANLLPCGLRLCITMGKTYPGAEAVLVHFPGFKDFSDATEGTAVATPTASAAAISEGPTNVPETGCTAKDGLGSGRSGQQFEPPGAATATPRSGKLCGGVASHASSSARPEGDAAVKALDRGPSSSVAVLKVCNQEINDLRRDAIELVFSKVIENQLTKHEKTDLVRTAIKALDRHMKEIFELELAPKDAPSPRVELPWTEEEQKRLEEAVVLYRRVAEPTLRWRNISSHVGSRTAKECAIRFQLCRENVLSQRQQAIIKEASINKCDKVEEQHDGTGESVHDNKGQDGEVHLGVEPQTLRGTDVSLIGSTTEGISSLHLSCIQLQVTCGRCRAAVDLRVSLPKDGASLEPAGCSVGCAKCQLRMGIRVQPVIGISGSQLMRVAIVQPVDCYLKDLLPCDFILACDCCGANMKAREVQSGSPRTNHCRHCHSKITFGFQGAALGLAVVCGLGTGDSRHTPVMYAMTARKITNTNGRRA